MGRFGEITQKTDACLRPWRVFEDWHFIRPLLFVRSMGTQATTGCNSQEKAMELERENDP
jgi:hypothetical protein